MRCESTDGLELAMYGDDIVLARPSDGEGAPVYVHSLSDHSPALSILCSHGIGGSSAICVHLISGRKM